MLCAGQLVIERGRVSDGYRLIKYLNKGDWQNERVARCTPLNVIINMYKKKHKT